MKVSSDRTKVVLRHLPPGISEAALMEQVDSAFAGRYNWVSFRPGKSSQKHQSFSRAYIDFQRPEDVLEFADFFNGHVFVNEKGSQFKTVVEYAPSQRIPKLWAKKDGREGTIYKDPEYLEFVESLTKPVENLPSAEAQLERREAERAGTTKDAPIITPLMDFVRQKRAAKSGSRRSSSNGKLARKSGGLSGGSPGSASSRKGSGKRRGSSTTMYVLRDALKTASVKDKSILIMAPKRDDRHFSDKLVSQNSSVGAEVLEEEGVSGNTDAGKMKILLVNGKGREITHVSGSMMKQQNVTPVKNISALKQNSQRDGNARIIKGILINKDARQSQYSELQSGHFLQASNLEKDKRLPRVSHGQLVLKDATGAPDINTTGNDLHGSHREKQERRARNKDRHDRSLWALRHSDGSYTSDDSLSFSASQSAQMLQDSCEGVHVDVKADLSNARSAQIKTLGSGRSHKHVGHRGTVVDGMPAISEAKSLKRGVASHGSHEKQVWVQKTSYGS